MSGAASEPGLTFLTASHELSLCLHELVRSRTGVKANAPNIWLLSVFTCLFLFLLAMGESQTVSGKSAASKFGYGE